MPAHPPPPLLQRLRTSAPGARWLWALLLALWLAPVLGQMHEVLHGPGGSAHAERHDEDDHGWGALFAGHGTAADCHLFDQLSHGGGAAPALAPPLPLLPVAHAIATPATGRLAVALAAAFQARAPPVFR